ncbi:hypothetical protein D9611_008123 [Ephemerocybe angulata]|uniref:Uncharacterized protein n=2 Tax=Ephemerocybe angulata TaxID=980116 RepID=A0A8H6I7S3_9AGAR|nr:hypothetical protein D9611_008123 [Tulosesus angulatus]KAF6759402.1 hypothetical protein DFP72DRAFT_134644 [Tulosesus angulatus]
MDDNVSAPPLRQPKQQYLGKNGFEVRFNDEPVTDNGLAHALNRHRAANHTLQTKGRPIPSLQKMQQMASVIATPSTIRERIKELQEEHLDELSELYDHHADDYEQDANRFYSSIDDDTQYDSYKRLEGFYEQHQHTLAKTSPLLNAYNEIRHIYLTRLLELQRDLKGAEEREATVMRAETAHFPRSSVEFRNATRPVQTRVARFLVADKPTQEKMLDEFGWAWRATEPLMAEFTKDATFAEHVRAALEYATTSADPRLKR